MTTHNQSLSEGLTLTDALVPIYCIGIIIEEMLTLADGASHITTFRRRLTDVLSLGDLGTTRIVNWNLAISDLLSNPDKVIAVRDAWNVIKHTVVPEMYQLENWAKTFEFLELFGHEYNRALGYSDSLPRVTGIRTAPTNLVPFLLRLIARVLDPRNTLADQLHELEQTVDVYKRIGRTGILERAVFLIEPTANPSIDFPDDEVLRWSDSPIGGWSNTSVWGDKLQYNHHVARLSIAISIKNIETLIAAFVPAGVYLIINIADVNITEISYDSETFMLVDEEEIVGVLDDPEDGDTDDTPTYTLPISLYMGDVTWHMGDIDKYLSDEANVNNQPFETSLEN
jgi:hypothetical protein